MGAVGGARSGKGGTADEKREDSRRLVAVWRALPAAGPKERDALGVELALLLSSCSGAVRRCARSTLIRGFGGVAPERDGRRPRMAEPTLREISNWRRRFSGNTTQGQSKRRCPDVG